MIEAQTYTLLLYEEVAFFKAHRDSGKVPGMFESLIICLPSCSEHTGGDVHLTHGSDMKVLSTSKTSGYDLMILLPFHGIPTSNTKSDLSHPDIAWSLDSI